MRGDKECGDERNAGTDGRGTILKLGNKLEPMLARSSKLFQTIHG